ncbi:MAG: hypothetical protein IT209_00815 [Armatimonadetes bacterium]|nr:hypothetical protein [Armatimonadota bacterium]
MKTDAIPDFDDAARLLGYTEFFIFSLRWIMRGRHDLPVPKWREQAAQRARVLFENAPEDMQNRAQHWCANVVIDYKDMVEYAYRVEPATTEFENHARDCINPDYDGLAIDASIRQVDE